MKQIFGFRQFVPTQKMKSYAETVLNQQTILFKDGIFLLAIMSKIKDNYFCCLTFDHRQRIYFADACATEPREALSRAEEILYYKLTYEEKNYPEYVVNDWNYQRLDV